MNCCRPVQPYEWAFSPYKRLDPPPTGSTCRWSGSENSSRFFSDRSCGTSHARARPRCSQPTRSVHPRAHAACTELIGLSSGQRARPQHVPQVATVRRSAHTSGVNHAEQPQVARPAPRYGTNVRACIHTHFADAASSPGRPSAHAPCAALTPFVVCALCVQIHQGATRFCVGRHFDAAPQRTRCGGAAGGSSSGVGHR